MEIREAIAAGCDEGMTVESISRAVGVCTSAINRLDRSLFRRYLPGIRLSRAIFAAIK